jgi:Ser/Thr protein kinase RdoA (MazF antagonist)
VTVTVEEFVSGEVKLVDVDLARKTGAVLARMHNIAQQQDLHVENQVLFDPFTHNDLFAFDVFLRLGEALRGEDRALFDRITDKYTEYMQALLPLKNQPRYAVQGDISQCNLYVTEDGRVGVFDFNRSGDNVLFCDAAMQAIFEARLMDYTETGEDLEDRLLEAFWAGYCAERPVSEEQWRWYGYLKAIIDAFWSGDIRWDEGSLLNAQAAGDDAAVSSWLKTIWQRLAGPESDL